jgi:hypothetical protein
MSKPIRTCQARRKRQSKLSKALHTEGRIALARDLSQSRGRK